MSHRNDEIDAISRRISDLSEESVIQLSQYISYLKWQEEQWQSPDLWESEEDQEAVWIYDLIEHFIEASQTATVDPSLMEIKVAPASCGGVMRQSIWQHPPVTGQSVLEYQLQVPIDLDILKMRFAVGVRDGAMLSQDNQVAFRVRVNGRPLWNHMKSSVVWENFTLDLPSLVGQQTVLQLITDPLGNSRWNWAVWGEPQVVGLAYNDV